MGFTQLMEARDAVTVLIADDSGLFAAALEAVLSGEEEIRVIGIAANGEEALALAREYAPDVALMDISMPVMDGFEAARLITAELPRTAVLMLTGSAAEDDKRQAKAAGAAGYVTKDQMAVALVRVIKEVAADRRPLS
ncbi:MAG: response regulator [Gaiellaceae bacterium]